MKRESHSDLVVVRHQPGMRLRQFFILLSFSIGAGLVGFVLGMLQADFLGQDATRTRAVLTAQAERLQEENTQLKQVLVKLEHSRRIDEKATSEARRTIRRLETRLSQVNSDLSFYKSIMAPGEVETSLRVQRMLLRPTVDERRFGYKISLTQVGDNRSYVGGVAGVNVIGQRNGEKEIIPLRDMSEAIDELGVVFRFRYFQDIEGELTLPEGFEAEAIQIVAQAKGEKAARVERIFEWRKLIGE